MKLRKWEFILWNRESERESFLTYHGDDMGFMRPYQCLVVWVNRAFILRLCCRKWEGVCSFTRTLNIVSIWIGILYAIRDMQVFWTDIEPEESFAIYGKHWFYGLRKNAETKITRNSCNLNANWSVNVFILFL